MGYVEGDPCPCSGQEPAGAILRLNPDGTPQGNSTAIYGSACYADWYLGAGKWEWRDGAPVVLPPDAGEATPEESAGGGDDIAP